MANYGQGEGAIRYHKQLSSRRDVQRHPHDEDAQLAREWPVHLVPRNSECPLHGPKEEGRVRASIGCCPNQVPSKRKEDVRECGSWEKGGEECIYLEIWMLFNFVHIG